jgi:hypothetical protein
MSAIGLGRVKTFRPRETGDAKLNLACCRNCEPESTWLARSAVSDVVQYLDVKPAVQAKGLAITNIAEMAFSIEK